MTAAIIRLADHRATSAVPAVQVDADQSMRDLLTALAAQDRAAVRLASAEGRGALPPEVAFLRRLWRAARVTVAIAQARHGRAALRVA